MKLIIGRFAAELNRTLDGKAGRFRRSVERREASAGAPVAEPAGAAER
jgi:hypothetical protein